MRRGSDARATSPCGPARPRRSSAPAGDEPSAPGEASKLAPGLHLVATPIGHLGDLGPRALATLTGADLLLCEDTRVTGRLLHLMGVRRRLQAYHEHNAERVRPAVLERLCAGASVALASDAGTPLVSDPGYKLVRAAIEAGIPVTAVPGPSAVLAALTVSGLPTDRFLFQGFLPHKGRAREEALAELRPLRMTLVLFESALRLPATLRDLESALGPRPAAVARELTKRFEEVRRGDLAELAAHYADAGPPKGEVVIVVGGAASLPDAGIEEQTVEAALAQALRTMPPAEAARTVARATGRKRAELYRLATGLARPPREDG